MSIPLHTRVTGLLLAALLLGACGGGATSSGVGGPGGNPNLNGNPNLSGLILACVDGVEQDVPCANIQLVPPEGLPPPPPPPGFLPGANFQGELLGDYTSVQSALVDAVTITPTAVVGAATIVVNGVAVTSGQTSVPIPLAAGEATGITVLVTAVNGDATRTYRITVTRLSPDNADLASLSISGGTFEPAFAPDVIEYTGNLPFTAAANIFVTATSVEPLALIEVNGVPVNAGGSSNQIPLTIGANPPIEVRVTALSNAQKTYSITLTRLGTAALSGLTLIGLTNDVPPQEIVLSPNPAFTADVLDYTSRVENRVEELLVTAVAAAPGAVIEINSVVVESGEEMTIELGNAGEGEEDLNEISIVVTHALSGEDEPFTRTYTLFVTRQEPPLFEPEAYLKPAGPGANLLFASAGALSVDGNTLAVGAPCAAGGGAVTIFVRVSDQWEHQQTLPGPGVVGAEFGRSVALSADGGFLAVGAPGTPDVPDTCADEPEEDITGAAYLYRRDGGAWTAMDTLSQFNPGLHNRFGDSIALSADGGLVTVAVGAPFESSETGGIHTEPVPGEHDDNGALGSGAVYVYSCPLGALPPCGLQAFIKSPEPLSALENQSVQENFGETVSLSADGNLLAIGMPGESSNALGINAEGTTATPQRGSGAVQLYTRTAGVWGEEDRILIKATLPRAAYRFGTALALSADGSTLVTGTPLHGGAGIGVGALEGPFPVANNSGGVHVFARDAEAEVGWVQQVFIKPSNTRAGLVFGSSLALSADGSRLVVGAPGENSSATTIDGNELLTNAPGSGAGYVYQRDDGAWSKIAYLKAPNSRAGISLGSVVAMSGDGELIVAGAPREGSDSTGVLMTLPYPVNNSSPNRGAAYLFRAIEVEEPPPDDPPPGEDP